MHSALGIRVRLLGFIHNNLGVFLWETLHMYSYTLKPFPNIIFMEEDLNNITYIHTHNAKQASIRNVEKTSRIGENYMKMSSKICIGFPHYCSWIVWDGDHTLWELNILLEWKIYNWEQNFTIKNSNSSLASIKGKRLFRIKRYIL